MNNPNQKPKFPLTLEQERLCSWMLIWQGGALLIAGVYVAGLL